MINEYVHFAGLTKLSPLRTTSIEAIDTVFNVNVLSLEEYALFVRYNGVIPNENSFVYEQRMYDKGLAFITDCGDGTISVVDAQNATAEYRRCLDENPYFFVNFSGGKLIQDKTFRLDHEMVAL